VLCGLPVVAIDDDGATRAERGFAVSQRPLLDGHSGTRAWANVETATLLARFVEDGHQTLAFTRSPRGAELVAAQARARLRENAATGPGLSRHDGPAGVPRDVP